MVNTLLASGLFFLGMFFLLASCVCAADVEQAVTSGYPLKSVHEVMPRGGLPNFYAKLAKQEPVRIAYFGGSITEQNGWRTLCTAWLKKMYPGSQITELPASIGGTGSEFGVFRVDKDVLKKRPDLVFVEFAINDTGVPPVSITKAMEGTVRKIWTANPLCDICFVYTVSKASLKFALGGTYSEPMSVMEEVATHYNIPSIHLGLEVAQLQKDGKLVMSSNDRHVANLAGEELNQSADISGKDKQGRIIFSFDGAHPYLDTGHMLYLFALKRGMEKIAATGTRGDHVLPAPLDPANWQAAKLISLAGNVKIEGGEKIIFAKPEKGGNLTCSLPDRGLELWKFAPGGKLSFTFRGSKVMLFDIIGPGCGALEITLDGKKEKCVRVDKYAGFYRVAALPVGDNLAEAEHKVEVQVLADDVDKKTIMGGSTDVDDNPQKYADKFWYCGGVALVGDLVKP